MCNALTNIKLVNKIALEFTEGGIDARIVNDKLQLHSTNSKYVLEPIIRNPGNNPWLLLQFRKVGEEVGYTFRDAFGIAYSYNYTLGLLQITLRGSVVECQMELDNGIVNTMKIFNINTYNKKIK